MGVVDRVHALNGTVAIPDQCASLGFCVVANLAILYNVNAMTTAFNDLRAEGHDIRREHMAKFSPYHTAHLGRLGSFELDLDKEVKPMRVKLEID